jgi:hypothetical protein
VEINRRYAERCTTHGQAVDRLETDGDHFALIDPTSADWQAIVQRITAAVDLREHVRGPS